MLDFYEKKINQKSFFYLKEATETFRFLGYKGTKVNSLADFFKKDFIYDNLNRKLIFVKLSKGILENNSFPASFFRVSRFIYFKNEANFYCEVKGIETLKKIVLTKISFVELVFTNNEILLKGILEENKNNPKQINSMKRTREKIKVSPSSPKQRRTSSMKNDKNLFNLNDIPSPLDKKEFYYEFQLKEMNKLNCFVGLAVVFDGNNIVFNTTNSEISKNKAKSHLLKTLCEWAIANNITVLKNSNVKKITDLNKTLDNLIHKSDNLSISLVKNKEFNKAKNNVL